jgi:pimeloyl-ACP methyl ester carboxylesterase
MSYLRHLTDMRSKPFRPMMAGLLIVLSWAVVFAQDPQPPKAGKAPIIVIPGITGSELVNSQTGKVVWFQPFRSKLDDIRLPISPDLENNRDSLVPGDIIRGVRFFRFLPEVEIYERLINALETRGGYREAKWDDPGENGHQDTFYVFPYDWRRDNVETARILVRKIEGLKKRLDKPDLRFNIIAHSMGGLVSRYAAMYGDSDIPAGRPDPSWAGGKHFERIFLLGTPNEGSVSALNALLNGHAYLGGRLNIPFVRNVNRFDVFSLPSAYQLLPHRGSFTVYDEDLEPMDIDLFDPQTWNEYDWTIWKAKDFEKRLSEAEQEAARVYFRTALKRAERFEEALNATSSRPPPVSFYLIGADCKDTPAAFILRRNEKRDKWITQFRPTAFRRSNGEQVTSGELKKVLYANGDSVVTKRSLASEKPSGNGGPHPLPVAAELYHCESHTRLVTNAEIQDKLFDFLTGLAAKLH